MLLNKPLLRDQELPLRQSYYCPFMQLTKWWKEVSPSSSVRSDNRLGREIRRRQPLPDVALYSIQTHALFIDRQRSSVQSIELSEGGREERLMFNSLRDLLRARPHRN